LFTLLVFLPYRTPFIRLSTSLLGPTNDGGTILLLLCYGFVSLPGMIVIS